MKKFSFIFVMAVVVFNLAFAPAFAGEAELEKEIKEMRKELGEIKRDIRGLKTLIEKRLTTPTATAPPARPPAPTMGKTSIKSEPYHGSEDAKVVIVEYSDYQCPFCARFFKNTLPLLKKNYIDTGKAAIVYKDFPLPFHKQAGKAAEAAHCAGEEGKFWEMHDMIFENQTRMQVTDLEAHAVKLGIARESFKECLTSGRHKAGIDKDIADGRVVGVQGTPSFFVGKLNDKGEVEGHILRGAQPYTAFSAVIERLLKQ